MRRRAAVLFGAVVVAMICWLAPANAAIMNYAGDPDGSGGPIAPLPALNGTDFIYTDVNESSLTDPVPLYGVPTTPINTLQFRNTANFGAFNQWNSPPFDTMDGQLNATVLAKPGKSIDLVNLHEFGDYKLDRDLSNSTQDAKAWAHSPGLWVTVLELNGVPVTGSQYIHLAPLVYGPSGGSYSILAGDPWVGTWTGDAALNLGAIYGVGLVTKVAVSFNNQFTADSETLTSALINKKGVDLSINIPEPMGLAAVAMFLPLLARSRRRPHKSDAQ